STPGTYSSMLVRRSEGNLLKIEYELLMTGLPEVTLPRLFEKQQGGKRTSKSGAHE
ncbi:uncharacterized, partial [Tachysurus ichikawai]